VRARPIVCVGCRRRYPLLGEIPVLLAEPDAYLESSRAQLTTLELQARQTLDGIQRQMGAPDAIPATRARCQAMLDALRDQLEDVRAILDPLLPPAGSAAREIGQRVPSTIEYLHYLYRDWGWPPEAEGENERALALLEAVAQQRPLGRVLVMGAGGCRLAYDLHRLDPGTETVVIDIDPLLFATAHRVVRGESVMMREANLEVGELDQGSREWVLAARGGALARDRFHFLLADALEPPFGAGAFDTVVTPWFVDEGPGDARDFISTLHRLLAPGGRWLSLGPLLYGPEVPIARRFGREELFDLAERAGFRVDGWRTASVPYLVSRLNGRGKVEWVLAFSATKLAPEALAAREGPASEGPPSWLIFSHFPVPTYAGQSLAWSGTPGYQLVISAIDGRRTVDDIARLIARQARDPGVSLGEIRAAVRQCLMDVHPGCRPAS
jgi:SAM-dependent methyltransferase